MLSIHVGVQKHRCHFYLILLSAYFSIVIDQQQS